MFPFLYLRGERPILEEKALIKLELELYPRESEISPMVC